MTWRRKGEERGARAGYEMRREGEAGSGDAALEEERGWAAEARGVPEGRGMDLEAV